MERTPKMLMLLALALASSSKAFDWSGECSGPGPCPPDSAACPPDSEASGNGTCACIKERCAQPSCKYGAHRELRRRASDTPGDCCDVYECVSPRERNCSGVSCPEEKLECPRDSYRLPSHRAPGDCCSVPQGCQCLPAPCLIANCSPGQRAKVVRLGNGHPGTCCPLFECVPQVDMAGNNDTPGPHGCVSSQGKILQNGDSWQEDPCTSCVCVDGLKKCQAYMCEVSCVNPTYVPDDCCPFCNSTSVVVVPPHCPALNNCSLRCLQGFVRDAAGCFLCQCKADECVLDCADGYEQDNHGNKLCQCATPPTCPPLVGCHKNCSHGYRLSKDGCPICRCNQCRQLTDCTKSCVHGLRTNDRGCTICKCRASAKSSVHLSPTVHFIGTSCASSDGRVHDEGETWFDGCRECYCHGGVEMCNLIACPVPNCTDPVFDSVRDCCPHCDGDVLGVPPRHAAMVCQSVDGAYRVEGESWQLDACTHCLCHVGRVLCETPRCPPAPCNHPMTMPDCCPRCRPRSGPSQAGRACGEGRSDGATWQDGACRSCECVAGRTQCYSQACPPVTCPRPVLLKNHCCPMCLYGGAPQVCAVGNMTYQEGEKWSEGPCVHCVCAKGVRSCEELVCPNHCADSRYQLGRCCLACPGVDNTAVQGRPGSGPLVDVAYIVVISLLCCVIACLVLYIWCGCRRRRHRLQLGGTCSNPAYNGFPHHQDHPIPLPPHYDTTDRRYRYKYVPTYDSQQIIKSPSIKSTEKSALAPI